MALYPLDASPRWSEPVSLREVVWWKTKKGEWKSGEVVKITEKLVKHYYTGEEREIYNISVRYKVQKFGGSYNEQLGGITKFYRTKPE